MASWKKEPNFAASAALSWVSSRQKDMVRKRITSKIINIFVMQFEKTKTNVFFFYYFEPFSEFFCYSTLYSLYCLVCVLLHFVNLLFLHYTIILRWRTNLVYLNFSNLGTCRIMKVKDQVYFLWLRQDDISPWFPPKLLLFPNISLFALTSLLWKTGSDAVSCLLSLLKLPVVPICDLIL